MRRLILVGAILLTSACGAEESAPKDESASGGGVAGQGTGGQGVGTGGVGTGGGGADGSGTEACFMAEQCREQCENFGGELDALLGDLSEVDPDDPPEVVELSCRHTTEFAYCHCVVESGGICWKAPTEAPEPSREKWKVPCPGAGGAGGGGGSN